MNINNRGMNSKVIYTVLLSLLILCPVSGLRGQTDVGMSARPLSEAAGSVSSPQIDLQHSLSGSKAVLTGTPMKFAIKTNLLYGGLALAPNLGLEAGLGRRSTLALGAGYNGWNLNGSAEDNRKLAHWLVQGEYRHWFCERFNGHFIGGHLLYTKYNISEHEMPLMFGKGSKEYRYDGWMAGVGFSYGYGLMLNRKWNIEFTIGVGYGYMRYDRYDCPHCGESAGVGRQRNYFGPTSAGITLVYLIK